MLHKTGRFLLTLLAELQEPYVATRALFDGDSKDYTFTNTGASLNVIYAKGGCSTTLSQHGGSASQVEVQKHLLLAQL